MNQAQPIVCVSFPAWEGNYVKSTVKLMSALAQDHPVLFVDYAYTWKDVWEGIRGKNQYVPWRAMLGLRPRLERVEAGPSGVSLHVLRLKPSLPVNWIGHKGLFAWGVRRNAARMERVIRRATEALGMAQPWVVNAFNPVYGLPLAGKLNESLLVYYCYDEIAAAPWAKKHGAMAEQAFLSRADLVITSSFALQAAKAASGATCYTVHNGVDLSIFNAAAPRKPGNSRPVAGYVGSIDDRLDYDLLEYLFQQLPGWQFRFVGRISYPEGKARLDRHHNVQCLGPMAPEALPEAMQGFDVGLIPFVNNSFTAGIYPMKANEYLALGLPVVATRFGDIEALGEWVRIADAPEAFMQAMLAGWRHDTDAQRAARKQYARENSWDLRARAFSRILQKAHQGRLHQPVGSPV